MISKGASHVSTGKNGQYMLVDGHRISRYKMRTPISCQSKMVGTRSWSRYVQLCACQLTVQRTTLVGAFEIRFPTLVHKQHETQETLTVTATVTPNPYGKLFEFDYNHYWHASFRCTVS